jgi:branched-subunit amino acid transport protein
MTVWLVLVAGGIATYLTRVLPLAVTRQAQVPGPVRRYLDALPTAIIAALAGAAVIAPRDTLTTGPEPVAAALVVLLAAWRRNLLLAVLAGVIGIAALRAFGL